MTYKTAKERDRADNLASPLTRQKDGDQVELQNSAVKIAPGTRDFQQAPIVGMPQRFKLTRTRVTSRKGRLRAADHFQAVSTATVINSGVSRRDSRVVAINPPEMSWETPPNETVPTHIIRHQDYPMPQVAKVGFVLLHYIVSRHTPTLRRGWPDEVATIFLTRPHANTFFSSSLCLCSQ
jgi:hypothetical protein